MTGIIGKISSRSKIINNPLTDGGILLGSGADAITATAVLANSEMLVGDGTTDPAIESGATLRTSIGVGTGDSPTFTSPTFTGNAVLGTPASGNASNLTSIPAANLTGTITSGTQDAITRLGTVTVGNLSNSAITYPSGHQVKQTFLGDIVAADIYLNSTSFTDSGIEVQHTTRLSSANSYLIYEFYGGMNGKIGDESPQLTVTMRTASNGTYEADERLQRGTYSLYYLNDSETYTYQHTWFRVFCGLVSEMGMPTAKDEWAAGDTLNFRLFGLRTGTASYALVHGGSTWNATVTEVAR
jgi:hypothetical protein